jgi:hypothetical protein
MSDWVVLREKHRLASKQCEAEGLVLERLPDENAILEQLKSDGIAVVSDFVTGGALARVARAYLPAG